MNDEIAKEIIADYIREEQGCKCGLYSLAPFVDYYDGDKEIALDGSFTVEDLEAFVQYMKEHKK